MSYDIDGMNIEMDEAKNEIDGGKYEIDEADHKIDGTNISSSQELPQGGCNMLELNSLLVDIFVR